MSDKFLPPIVILGSERSGTNLLRVLLNSHSKISSPPPAGFVEVLGGIQERYFPLNQPPYLEELIDDIILCTQTHHNPWDIELNPQMIMSMLKTGSFWEIVNVINLIYADKTECSTWCSKEPGLFRFIYEIKAHLPNAKFIYLVRDGRDVAASMLQGHLHEFHVYFAAHNWASTQQYCLKALADPAINSQIFVLKYEDLIDNPKKSMNDLMQFVGLEFEESQLHYYRNEDVITHSKKSRFWKNISKAIDSKNKGNYIKNLGIKNVEIFESIAWNELVALGYKPESLQRKVIADVDVKLYKRIALLRKKFWSMDLRPEAFRQRIRFKKLDKIRNRTFKSPTSAN